jgi:hypothetical protein
VNQHLPQADLERYLRRELTPANLLAADDHLAACAACRAKLAAFADVPPRVRFLQSELGPRRRAPRYVAAALGVAAVVMAGIVMLREPAIPKRTTIAGEEVPAALNLSIPPEIARSLHPPGAVLRGPEEIQSMQPRSPVATAILANPPEFRWLPEPGADWYEVAVFTADLRPVIESGHVRATAWRPSKPLQPGQSYIWQITTSVRGRRVLAPDPPAPEARFWVLSEAEANRLATFAAGHMRDHLLLGVMYAQSGVLEPAREEFRKALADGHPEADRLLRAIQPR